MPKMKTHSGTKKRFKLTGRGKVRGRHSFTSHILEKKSPKRKRRLGKPAEISRHDERQVKTLLGAKRHQVRPSAPAPDGAPQQTRRTGS